MDINSAVAAVKQNKKLMLSIIFMLCVLTCVAGYIISINSGEIVIFSPNQTEQQNDDFKINTDKFPKTTSITEEKNNDDINNVASSQTEKEKIKVYVAGCVNNPGVYTVEKGCILQDAIISAGGLTEEADPENINMVYEIKENMMIKILPKKHADAQIKTSAEEIQNKASGKVVIDKKEGTGVIVYASSYTDENNQSKQTKININTASRQELEGLPGIGPATARDIIEYRNKNGKFKTISDIMKVPGIKQSRYNAIKDFICTD